MEPATNEPDHLEDDESCTRCGNCRCGRSEDANTPAASPTATRLETTPVVLTASSIAEPLP
jgi:hypothetical protein